MEFTTVHIIWMYRNIHRRDEDKDEKGSCHLPCWPTHLTLPDLLQVNLTHKQILSTILNKYLIIPPGQRTRWWPFSVHFQSGCQWTGDSPRPPRSKQCQEFPEFIFSTLSKCNCIPLWIGVFVFPFELVPYTGAYLPIICFPIQVSYICLYISFYSALFTIIYIIYNSFSFLQNCKLTLCEARMTNSLASWK